MEGLPVHGYASIDGDATGGATVALNQDGSNAVYNLSANQIFYVESMVISCQDGGDIQVNASATPAAPAANEIILTATVPATFMIELTFPKPFVCPAGQVPTLIGVAANIDTISCEGFVREV